MDDAGENPVPGGSADAAGPSYDFFDRPVDEAGCTDVLVQKDEDLTPTAPDMGTAPPVAIVYDTDALRLPKWFLRRFLEKMLWGCGNHDVAQHETGRNLL